MKSYNLVLFTYMTKLSETRNCCAYNFEGSIFCKNLSHSRYMAMFGQSVSSKECII